MMTCILPHACAASAEFGRPLYPHFKGTAVLEWFNIEAHIKLPPPIPFLNDTNLCGDIITRCRVNTKLTPQSGLLAGRKLINLL